ncbi:MAG: hypothetical protein KGI06_02315 [Candidatus Micrarchaeota archaeon]|nr:hypothetical protein [Candidatus Micrarchaeota archaeon]
MATQTQPKTKSATKPRPKAAAPRSQRKNPGAAKYIVATILVVIIIIAAIFADSLFPKVATPSSSFTVFKNNFNSAPRVNIFVAAYNGTVLSSTVGCATAIIEQIVASRSNHRNASTIDLNIINQTSCIRTTGLGTKNVSNYTTTSLQNCLNTSSTEPSIYINYSATNTTIIRPEYLYMSGDSMFLSECGLASEISQGG